MVTKREEQFNLDTAFRRKAESGLLIILFSKIWIFPSTPLAEVMATRKMILRIGILQGIFSISSKGCLTRALRTTNKSNVEDLTVLNSIILWFKFDL